MYTFIISPPRTESIVPLLRTTLNGKFIKRKNNKHTQIQTQTRANMHTSAHISIPKDSKHTHTVKYFSKARSFHHTVYKAGEEMQPNDAFLCACCSAFLYPYQRLNQIYEPVMKHFMLIVFVYEQINGSRAKRMMM